MSQKISVPQYDGGDEIDLIELLENLWEQKWLIAAVTTIGAIAALLYAFLVRPVYQTAASVMPPRASDIAGYNIGHLSLSATSFLPSATEASIADTVAPQAYSTEDVYGVFKRNLLSASLRNDFFESFYLPYRGLSSGLEKAARDRLLADFAKVLVVRQPNARERPDYYVAQVELNDPELAAEWANAYVQKASSRAEQEMLENIQSDLRTRSRVAEKQVMTLRATARQQREDRIARLSEALRVASALGIETPQVTAGRVNADSVLAAFVEGDLMYLRGTQALQAELDVLAAREDDDPFIPELRRLQNRLELLRSIVVDSTTVAVFTLDGAAEVPEAPVKPKKALILALGVVLGGVLGIGIALVRVALRHRKKPLEKSA